MALAASVLLPLVSPAGVRVLGSKRARPRARTMASLGSQRGPARLATRGHRLPRRKPRGEAAEEALGRPWPPFLVLSGEEGEREPCRRPLRKDNGGIRPHNTRRGEPKWEQDVVATTASSSVLSPGYGPCITGPVPRAVRPRLLCPPAPLAQERRWLLRPRNRHSCPGCCAYLSPHFPPGRKGCARSATL